MIYCCSILLSGFPVIGAVPAFRFTCETIMRNVPATSDQRKCACNILNITLKHMQTWYCNQYTTFFINSSYKTLNYLSSGALCLLYRAAPYPPYFRTQSLCRTDSITDPWIDCYAYMLQKWAFFSTSVFLWFVAVTLEAVILWDKYDCQPRTLLAIFIRVIFKSPIIIVVSKGTKINSSQCAIRYRETSLRVSVA